MRFFGSAILAVATLASIVSGQASVPGTATSPPATTTPAPSKGGNADALGDNPISSPTVGDEIKAGKPVTIVWNPTTEGTITLRLRKGESGNLDTVQEITKNIPNSGTFTWTPSAKLEGDEDYAVEIVPSSGEPNYSPKFAIDSEGSGLSSSKTTSTATTLATSTTKTTTSTKPTTTDKDEEEDEDTKTTTTKVQTSTNTTTSATSVKTATPEDDSKEDDSVPNTNSATGIASSPLALVLCLAAAVAYLN